MLDSCLQVRASMLDACLQVHREPGTEPDFRLRGGKKYVKKILDL